LHLIVVEGSHKGILGIWHVQGGSSVLQKVKSQFLKVFENAEIVACSAACVSKRLEANLFLKKPVMVTGSEKTFVVAKCNCCLSQSTNGA